MGRNGKGSMSAEDEFEETRRAIHRMLKDAFEGKVGVFREPFIYGFTTRSRDSRLEPARLAVENLEVVTRDPLVDVMLTESAIYLTAEMPGMAADDIRVGLEQGQLTIQGEGDRRYYSSVDLPADIEPDTLKHTFMNGVLDIVIARKRL
jgi:HSP20 family protein